MGIRVFIVFGNDTFTTQIRLSSIVHTVINLFPVHGRPHLSSGLNPIASGFSSLDFHQPLLVTHHSINLLAYLSLTPRHVGPKTLFHRLCYGRVGFHLVQEVFVLFILGNRI